MKYQSSRIHANNTVEEAHLSYMEDRYKGEEIQLFQDAFGGDFVHPAVPEVDATHGSGALVVERCQGLEVGIVDGPGFASR